MLFSTWSFTGGQPEEWFKRSSVTINVWWERYHNLSDVPQGVRSTIHSWSIVCYRGNALWGAIHVGKVKIFELVSHAECFHWVFLVCLGFLNDYFVPLSQTKSCQTKSWHLQWKHNQYSFRIAVKKLGRSQNNSFVNSEKWFKWTSEIKLTLFVRMSQTGCNQLHPTLCTSQSSWKSWRCPWCTCWGQHVRTQTVCSSQTNQCVLKEKYGCCQMEPSILKALRKSRCSVWLITV